MYLRVTKGDTGEWHVQLVGSNGEIMMSSENYYDKGNAIRAARNLGHALTLNVTLDDGD